MTEPTIRRFRRGPAEVDAVQVAGCDTGNTARAIAKWCGGATAGTWDRPRIHVWEHPDGPDDAMTARVGMWITREPDGRYQVHQDREFRAAHQAIGPAPSLLPIAPRVGGEPTAAQLDALLDRAERHVLSHAEAELLTATVRRLVEERDSHAAAVQRVRDLHRPFVDRRRGLLTLEYARPGATTPAACAECHDELLPCPTIRALDAQPEPAADTERPAPQMPHPATRAATTADAHNPVSDIWSDTRRRYIAGPGGGWGPISQPAPPETTSGRLSVADLAGGDPALSEEAKAVRDENQAFLEEAALSTDLPASTRIHHEPTAPLTDHWPKEQA